MFDIGSSTGHISRWTNTVKISMFFNKMDTA
jgi:hypothetical protein